MGLDYAYWSSSNNLTLMIINYVAVGMAVTALILPMDVINKRLFPIDNEEVFSPLTYTMAKLKFTSNYDITNPLTKDIALAAQLLEIN